MRDGQDLSRFFLDCQFTIPARLCSRTTQQDALDAMTTDEAQLVSAVSMLKALGVEEESDIEVHRNPVGPRKFLR